MTGHDWIIEVLLGIIVILQLVILLTDRGRRR